MAEQEPQNGGVCRTVLLDDDPTDSDEFGSHGRTAGAIADLVKTSDGGKAIALTGSWGSGKSTVVKILSENLRQDGNAQASSQNKVFVFDAWSHQGDPLRRTFLETLIKFLNTIGWTAGEKWEKDRERVSRRLQETDTSSSPILPWPGRLLVLSLLLAPLGNSLFGQGLKNNAYLLIGTGLFFILLPVLIPTAVWILGRPTWRFWAKEFWTKSRYPHDEDNLVYLFINKTKEITKSKTIQTPDPTSLEFQEIFTRLLEDALSKPDRILVVVIDNLDRVDPEQALSIWSTMRTFFENEAGKEQPWLSRFWLLVPFDREALNRWWRKEKSTNPLSASFMDKTFQIEFFVSPPVQSDWEQFFRKQFERAFPDHATGDDFYTPYRLYHLKKWQDKRPVTPRDIKIFINRVGALHRQWQDEIPLPMQVLYTAYTDEATKFLNDPTQPIPFDDATSNLIAGTDWQKSLAAIYFNVEEKKALQIWIDSKVAQALQTGNADSLREVKDVPGFLTVCQDIVQRNYIAWAGKDPAILAEATLCIDSLEKESSTLEFGKIREWIREGIVRVEKWQRLNTRIGQGIASIIKYFPEQQRKSAIEKVLKSISKPTLEVENAKEANVSAEVTKEWVAGASKILSSVRDSLGKEPITQHFRVPGGAALYIQIMLSVCQSAEQDLMAHFSPSIGRKEIVAQLAKSCTDGKLDKNYARLFEVLRDMGGDWQWSELANAISQRLQPTSSPSTAEATSALKILLRLYFAQQDNQILEQLVSQGIIFHQLHLLRSDPSAVAHCILALLESKKTPAAPPNITNATSGLSLYQNILQNPANAPGPVPALVDATVYFQRVSELINKMNSAPETKTLIVQVIELIAARPDAEKYFSLETICGNFNSFEGTLNENALKNLVSQAAKKLNLLIYLTEQTFQDGLAWLYLLAYQEAPPESPEGKKYEEFLVKEFESLQRAIWLREISQEGKLLELAFNLIDRNAHLKFTSALQDALVEHVRKILDGQQSPSKFAKSWGKLVYPSNEAERQVFIGQVRDEVLKEPTRKALPVLKLYGGLLLTFNTFSEKPDDTINNLFPEIIKRQDTDELTWVSQLLQKDKTLLGLAKGASVKVFRKRIKEQLRADGSASQDVKTHLERIAKLINVDSLPADAHGENPGEDEANAELTGGKEE